MKAVIYTDGGALTNPGKIGYAFHGYTYEESSNKPIKADGWTLTNEGYVKNIHEDDVWVTPSNYIDFLASSTKIETNNIAEILAMTEAFKHIKKLKISEAIVYTDSKYVSNGINEWLEFWIPNNFIKSNGEEVLNSYLWKKLSDIISEVEEEGIEVSVRWIKAHNGNLGNERVDQLATIANNMAIDNKVFSEFKKSEVSNYWKPKSIRNPLINFKRIYFNSLSSYNKTGTYYQGNPADKDMYIGKRLPGDGYSILRLHDPDPIMESVIERQVEICRGYNGVYLCKLEKLYKKEDLRYIEQYGGYALRPINHNNDLESVTKSLITMELNPTGLSLRAIDNFNYLEDILDTYLAVKEDKSGKFDNVFKIEYKDITDLFFESVTKKKQTIKKLKSTITPNTKTVKVSVERNGKEITLPLTMGIDIPGRNNLNKLDGDFVKIDIVTWSASDNSIGYAVVIKYMRDIGIWTDFFSDRVYLK